MHVDHFTYAAGPDGLMAEVNRLSELLGAEFKNGGFHPQFGTRNYILPLADDRYLEVVEVLDHPVADKVLYGQVVRQRSSQGGGWLSWIITVDESSFDEIVTRIDRPAVYGARTFPDGRKLEWRQIGLKDVIVDPQLPYFIHWDSPVDVLPSALSGDISVQSIELAGSQQRVEDFLQTEIDGSLDGIEMKFNSPSGRPSLDAITFATPDNGIVRI